MSKLDTFKDWQEFARVINARAKRLQDSIHARGWSLAASVGIPHCMCCLHNASIDDNMTGWCAGNPKRLKVAKQAAYILDNWEPSRKAERIIAKAWNRMAKKTGFCCAPIENRVSVRMVKRVQLTEVIEPQELGGM